MSNDTYNELISRAEAMRAEGEQLAERGRKMCEGAEALETAAAIIKPSDATPSVAPEPVGGRFFDTRDPVRVVSGGHFCRMVELANRVASFGHEDMEFCRDSSKSSYTSDGVSKGVLVKTGRNQWRRGTRRVEVFSSRGSLANKVPVRTI